MATERCGEQYEGARMEPCVRAAGHGGPHWSEAPQGAVLWNDMGTLRASAAELLEFFGEQFGPGGDRLGGDLDAPQAAVPLPTSDAPAPMPAVLEAVLDLLARVALAAELGALASVAELHDHPAMGELLARYKLGPRGGGADRPDAPRGRPPVAFGCDGCDTVYQRAPGPECPVCGGTVARLRPRSGR